MLDVERDGVRVVAVERGALESELSAPGAVDFNGRDLAIVQARAAGFVQRVPARAPGDVIAAGAPLAELLIPEWGGAQAEYLAVRKTGDASLTGAARQRLAGQHGQHPVGALAAARVALTASAD